MHHGLLHIDDFATSGAAPGLGPVKCKFVHYPDCQQLIVWLPAEGRDYGNLSVVDRASQRPVFAGPVTKWLNGSIQLLFDTVDVPPGCYTLTIDHPSGLRHTADFVKFEPGVTPPKPPAAAPAAASAPRPPIQYHDGAGTPIPDVDAQLRAQCLRDVAARFSRHLEYAGNFRAGTITFVEGELRIRFEHEMGGGNCKFYIEVPTAAQWEAATATTLSRRQEIVEWLAATVQREQASSWRYEITADQISFY